MDYWRIYGESVFVALLTGEGIIYWIFLKWAKICYIHTAKSVYYVRQALVTKVSQTSVLTVCLDGS